MTSITSFFPTKFLAAADVAGGDLTVTIDSVDAQSFRQDDGGQQIKPVLVFKEPGTKNMVLNKSNSLMLGGLFGDDTDSWTGKRVTLYHDMVPFKGKPVATVRLRKATSEKAAAFNDSVPF